MLRPTALLRVGDAKVRSQSARPPQHTSCDDEEPIELYSIGHVHVTLYERTVTKADRDRWRREDEERDRRRIPLGFRAP